MIRRRTCLALAVVGLAGLLVPSAPAVAAPANASPAIATTSDSIAPDASGPGRARTVLGPDWAWKATPTGWALPLSYLGWGETLSFRSDEPLAAIDLPHSRGHALQRLELTLEIPDFTGEVTLDVAVDGRSLHHRRYEPGTTTDVVIDLPPTGRRLDIEARPVTGDECRLIERPYHAHIATPVLFYATDAATPPATAGTFTPPDVVTAATFVVEPSRSQFADGAVLDATTTLARAFAGTQRIAITSEGAQPRAADLGPFGLLIAVAEREQAEVRAAGASGIQLSGRSDALITQARGLDQAIAALGVTETLTVQQAPVPNDHRNLEPVPVPELPGARLFEAGGRRLEVLVPLSQTAFGQAVDSYEVRLGGVVSPAEAAGLGGSQLSLWLGDELLELVEMTPQGRFDTEIAVSADDTGRAAELRLRFDAAGENCARADLYHLQLDPGSWVTARPGQTLSPGLDRFPQVAGSGLRVLPGRDQAQLSLTAEMVALLQESMPGAIRIEVVDRGGALAEGPGPLLVVDPDVELQEALGAPTNPRLGRLDAGDVRIQSDGLLDYSVTLQGFVTAGGTDVIMIEGSAHDGAGGLPDTLVERGMGLLTGSAVTVGADDAIMRVAGTQQTRHDQLLLASTAPVAESRSARSSFTTGLFLAAVGGAVVLAARPLRNRARIRR